jgi:hypothetical protein
MTVAVNVALYLPLRLKCYFFLDFYFSTNFKQSLVIFFTQLFLWKIRTDSSKVFIVPELRQKSIFGASTIIQLLIINFFVR